MYQLINIDKLKHKLMEYCYLTKSCKDTNINNLLSLTKIVISCSITTSSKTVITNHIKMITGQTPVIINAKKSIAQFCMKRNDDIALKVTLRNNSMYTFLVKLIYIALPCKKVNRTIKVDNINMYTNNINIGIHDMLIFPELMYNSKDIVKSSNIYGCNISITFKNSNIVRLEEFLKVIYSLVS